MQSSALFAIGAALLAGGVAIAQSISDNAPVKKHPRYMARFDQQFKAADKDGDGALTKEEAANAGMSRIVEHFDQIDVNKDGKVTPEEIRGMIRHRVSS